MKTVPQNFWPCAFAAAVVVVTFSNGVAADETIFPSNVAIDCADELQQMVGAATRAPREGGFATGVEATRRFCGVDNQHRSDGKI